MKCVIDHIRCANKHLEGGQTGYYLPEAAHPYYILSHHFHIDFASPKGPNPPLDEESIAASADDKQSMAFLRDETVKSKMASAKKLAEVDAKAYEAIFYVGGRGPVIDLPFDEVNTKLASEFYNSGKITAAVCHGPAALVEARTPDGKSIFAGKKFTGFSDAEEALMGSLDYVPFLLEDKIKELGGIYFKADEPFGVKVIVDGNLYTGQNPASAGPLAEEVLKALQK